MFLWLLLSSLCVSVAFALAAILIFRTPIEKTLTRIAGAELALSWKKFIQFALFVVGVSGGIRVWNLEKYLPPITPDSKPVVLTSERWVLELYGVMIETLQSMAWMLFIFFLFTLITIGILRIFEMKAEKKPTV